MNLSARLILTLSGLRFLAPALESSALWGGFYFFIFKVVWINCVLSRRLHFVVSVCVCCFFSYSEVKCPGHSWHLQCFAVFQSESGFRRLNVSDAQLIRDVRNVAKSLLATWRTFITQPFTSRNPPKHVHRGSKPGRARSVGGVPSLHLSITATLANHTGLWA